MRNFAVTMVLAAAATLLPALPSAAAPPCEVGVPTVAGGYGLTANCDPSADTVEGEGDSSTVPGEVNRRCTWTLLEDRPAGAPIPDGSFGVGDFSLMEAAWSGEGLIDDFLLEEGFGDLTPGHWQKWYRFCEVRKLVPTSCAEYYWYLDPSGVQRDLPSCRVWNYGYEWRVVDGSHWQEWVEVIDGEDVTDVVVNRVIGDAQVLRVDPSVAFNPPQRAGAPAAVSVVNTDTWVRIGNANEFWDGDADSGSFTLDRRTDWVEGLGFRVQGVLTPMTVRWWPDYANSPGLSYECGSVGAVYSEGASAPACDGGDDWAHEYTTSSVGRVYDGAGRAGDHTVPGTVDDAYTVRVWVQWTLMCRVDGPAAGAVMTTISDMGGPCNVPGQGGFTDVYVPLQVAEVQAINRDDA